MFSTLQSFLPTSILPGGGDKHATIVEDDDEDHDHDFDDTHGTKNSIATGATDEHGVRKRKKDRTNEVSRSSPVGLRLWVRLRTAGCGATMVGTAATSASATLLWVGKLSRVVRFTRCRSVDHLMIERQDHHRIIPSRPIPLHSQFSNTPHS